MFKFWSLPAIFLFLTGSVLAQDWAWKPFNPAGQAWSVLAPGEMKPDEEALAPGAKMGSYSYSDFYGFFAVVYRDAPKPFLIPVKPDKSAHYKKVKGDFIKATKGQFLKETEFESGRAKGRELYLKIPSGTITGVEGQTITKYRIQRLRMFFVGRRFFMLLAVLPEDIIDTPPVNKFFDSFTFNTAPTAVADAYTLDEDAVLTIDGARGVLANDRDEEDDKLAVALAKAETLPEHGALSLNADGSFTYTPQENFNGTDSFTYKANDGQADSAPVTVIIKINPVNDAPTISLSQTSAAPDELTQLGLAAIANDIDTPKTALRFSLNGAPAGATIDPVSGAFSWTPSEAQGPGNFAFRVNVSDGSASASQTVSVAVNEVNVAPQLSNVPSGATINELSAYTFASNGLDADIPAQTLTYSLIDAPAGASINPTTGVFSWTPTEKQGNNSVYSFTVRVSDGAANTDVPVKLTAREVNSAPVMSAIAAQTVDELKTFSLTATSSDTDDPVNTLIYSLENAPDGMTIDAGTGAISWTPTEAQGAGVYNVTVRVMDNGSPALSAEETVTITVREVNKPPDAATAEINGIEDRAVLFALKATDADLPANTLVFSVVKPPANGTLSGTGANLTYTPKADFNGTDSFTFKVNDGAADSSVATVTLRIAPVNDAPVANPDSATTRENVPVIINVLSNDTDVDGDALVISNVSDAVGGSVEIVNGSVRFTPDQGFRGAGGFKYTIKDGQGATAAGSVTITVSAPESGN